MSFSLVRPSFDSFSEKTKEKILFPSFFGSLSPRKEPHIHHVEVFSGNIQESNYLCIYAHVDTTRGVFVDLSYQLFGPSILIALAETLCSLLLQKSYFTCQRIDYFSLDQELRDKKDIAAFPLEVRWYVNITISVAEQLFFACQKMSKKGKKDGKKDEEKVTDDEGDNKDDHKGIEGWLNLSKMEQKELVEEVLNKEIRPYVEQDGGGVEVVDVQEGKKVIISYQGACVGCFASTGSTLTAIQEMLRKHLYRELIVIPENVI
jgi:NifU-like protein